MKNFCCLLVCIMLSGAYGRENALDNELSCNVDWCEVCDEDSGTCTKCENGYLLTSEGECSKGIEMQFVDKLPLENPTNDDQNPNSTADGELGLLAHLKAWVFAMWGNNEKLDSQHNRELPISTTGDPINENPYLSNESYDIDHDIYPSNNSHDAEDNPYLPNESHDDQSQINSVKTQDKFNNLNQNSSSEWGLYIDIGKYWLNYNEMENEDEEDLDRHRELFTDFDNDLEIDDHWEPLYSTQDYPEENRELNHPVHHHWKECNDMDDCPGEFRHAGRGREENWNHDRGFYGIHREMDREHEHLIRGRRERFYECKDCHPQDDPRARKWGWDHDERHQNRNWRHDFSHDSEMYNRRHPNLHPRGRDHEHIIGMNSQMNPHVYHHDRRQNKWHDPDSEYRDNRWGPRGARGRRGMSEYF